MKRAWRYRSRATGAAACLALLQGSPLQAAEWSLQTSAQGRARASQESPDAPLAAPTQIHETRLLGSAVAARALENSASTLDGSLDLPVGVQSGGSLVLGRLLLGQTLSSERDSWAANAERSVDDNQADQRTASDAVIGRRRRNNARFGVVWQRAIAPRLSAQTEVSTAYTGYTGAQPQSFRNSQGGATVTYLWDERLRPGLTASHTRYAQTGSDNLTTSDSLRFNLGWALSEITSLNVGLGGYRTEQQGLRRSLACPLPASFCNAGLVAPVLVQEVVRMRTNGSQFTLGLQSALDETRGYSLTASRQLLPSVFGVLLEESVSAAVNQAVTPRLNLAFNASQSRSSSAPVGNGARPSLSTLDASLNCKLQERLSLSAGLTLRRLQDSAAGQGSRTAQFSISLQYQPSKILATR